MIIAEYIWLDNNGDFRSKARSLEIGDISTFLSERFMQTNSGGTYTDDGIKLNNGKMIPKWNYDGSSTGQASGNDSEIIIVPRNVYKCPFRGNAFSSNILVLCDTYKPDGTPLSNNYRPQAEKIFNEYYLEQPWYGLEQEYFIINPNTNLPLGFRGFETNPNSDSFTQPQGQYYCSVGAGNAFGRKLVNLHYEYCLKMGLGISGINAEVAPGQWEFQIGPVEGIEAADQLMIARYVLIRLAEDFDLKITFHPKPLSGDWNGSGCHTNFSTYKMRSENGLDVIQSAIEKLSKKHDEHMKVYGTDNNLRMSGEHETAKFDEFSYGVANRGASVRIPNEIYKNKKGYFEDRRPSANCDPYLVCSKILETCCESDSDSENNE